MSASELNGGSIEQGFGSVVSELSRPALRREACKGPRASGKLPNRAALIETLNRMRRVLFPGHWGAEFPVESGERQRAIRHEVETIAFELGDAIFRAMASNGECDEQRLEERSHAATKLLVQRLPFLRERLLEDLSAAYDGDPAAGSLDEILLAYPGLFAIGVYRIAHEIYLAEVPLLPRIMSEHAHHQTGIDIHPGASIGPRFFIDHGTGIVIGETTVIGRNVRIYQGVTLGAISLPHGMAHPQESKKRHPTIEDDVVIYANATILGGETVIGRGAIVGGNAWITRSVGAGERILRTNSVGELTMPESVNAAANTGVNTGANAGVNPAQTPA